MQVDASSTVEHFRLLCVGLPGVGKSSVINYVFGIDEARVADWEVGEADINRELTSDENQLFVLHDCKGFEPGDNKAFDTTSEFINRRRGEGLPLKDQLHAVWLFTETPRAGGNAFGTGDEKFLQLAHKTQTPLVVVFTKYDRLIRTKKDELQEDEGDLAPGDLDRRSREEAQGALDKCLESLKRTTIRLQTPMPRYVKVSSLPGYDADISLLAEVTRDAVQEKLKGDAPAVWTIAQRAMSNVQVPQPEHGAK